MKKFLILIILLSGNLALSFSFTSKFCSYPQPQDFSRLLKEKLKYTFSDKTFKPGNGQATCMMYGDSLVMGANDPATGLPVFAEPSPSFVRLYSTCIYPLVRIDIYSALVAAQETHRYLSEETLLALVETEKKSSHGSFYMPSEESSTTYKPDSKISKILGQRYTDLPPELKKAILHDLLVRFIGPGILSPNKEKLYLAKIEKGTDGGSVSTVLGDEIIQAVFLMSMTPEFLTSCSSH